MYTPYNDPVVMEKHRTQKRLMKKSGNDMKAYSQLVQKRFKEIQKIFGLKFKTVSLDKQLSQ